LLPFIIAGITVGSVYGVAGLGLVLTYRTSGTFNFAHGALATVSAFLFYTLYVLHHVAWPLAALVCIGLVGTAMAFLLERIARSVANGATSVQIVASVGVLLIIQSTVELIYGASNTFVVPEFLPTRSFTVDRTVIHASDVITFAFGVLVCGALFALLRYTRLGISMRAVVSNPDQLALTGRNPNAVRRAAWVIGSCLAGVSGILLAPLINLDATTLTLLVVQAFGAAAIGRFTSLPWTYAGGIAIGLLTSFATRYFTSGLLGSLPPAIPFIILFCVMLGSRRGTVSVSQVDARAASNWRAPWAVQAMIAVPTLVILIWAPSFASFHLTDWTVALTDIIMFLSIGLVVRAAGQVSLAQTGFLAIGACAFCHFTQSPHVPWAVGVLGAGLIAAPIGAVLALPAMRASPLHLSLASLGFSIVVAYMFYTQSFMFGSADIGLVARTPSLPGLDIASEQGYYYLVLIIVIIGSVVLMMLDRSRLGRLSRAFADSSQGLSLAGASVNVTVTLAFTAAAFFTAVAGALTAVAQGVTSADSFPPLLSFSLFAVTVIAAGGSPWYGLLAAAGVALVPSYFPGTNSSLVLNELFGVFAIAYALTPAERRGLPIPVIRVLDRIGRLGSRGDARAMENPRPSERPSLAKRRASDLRVSGLQVRYGGVLAVDDFDCRVASGQIVGLIGPNGAGKTTSLNAISGLVRPYAGRIELNGTDLTHLSPASRARLGLGRTLQRMELFDSLSVWENVFIGAEASEAGRNPIPHVAASAKDRRRLTDATQAALELCGITQLRDKTAGSLSTGQRRLLDFARCIAGRGSILLLDEPSSGLDRSETQEFGRMLVRAVRELGIGVLLIEHDMALVQGVCDYVYVLDFGKSLVSGPTREVMDSAAVRAAYLGTDDPPDMAAQVK
jgi:ABC-type branched-subunit amino acid transport system ATPase component/branched-subunit amino acid ABC-type transport system permease component